MNVQIRDGFERANSFNADVRVIIDVFRASTTALAILEKMPAEYLIANDKEVVERFANNSYRVVSEVFDLGIDNSPTLVQKLFSGGDRVIHKTTNLTTAIEHNYFENPVLIACFNNLGAISQHLKSLNFLNVEIVPAGQMADRESTKEDTHCAELLKARLLTDSQRDLDLEYLLGNFEEKKKTRGWPQHFIEDIELAVKLDLSECLPVVTRQSEGIFSVRAFPQRRPQ